MGPDHTYPPFCQAQPASHWRATDPPQYALPPAPPNRTSHHGHSPQPGPHLAQIPAMLPPILGTPGPQPMGPISADPPQHSGNSKRQRPNSQGHGGDSGGSEKACSSDEAARILEERRRRNANASARFRKRRNERERELVQRCKYLESQLRLALGPAAFDAAIRGAPAVERSLLHRYPTGFDDDEGGSPSPVSVSALTAPKSIDDVWAAYLQLNEQVAGITQRMDALETSTK